MFFLRVPVVSFLEDSTPAVLLPSSLVVIPLCAGGFLPPRASAPLFQVSVLSMCCAAHTAGLAIAQPVCSSPALPTTATPVTSPVCGLCAQPPPLTLLCSPCCLRPASSLLSSPALELKVCHHPRYTLSSDCSALSSLVPPSLCYTHSGKIQCLFHPQKEHVLP